MKNRYRTAPLATQHLPPGIPFIIANELAERFSYYGMRAILVIFMTQYLLDANGQLATMPANEATAYFHLFVSITYFTPFLGAILADGVWGKYRTIITLSLIYCLGHFCLALDSTRLGLLLGQGLIALGAGGIKPCVSAHLGDQFGLSNQHRLSTVFSWFYMALNSGAFIAMLWVPWLLQTQGAATAFAVPGVLMVLATLVFWSGRYRFAHIPPAGMKWVREALSGESLDCFSRLLKVYVFIAVFWALFDQNGSSWVLQAQQMDRHILGIEVLPSQIQAANPLLIVILTPLFYRLLYPAIHRYIPMTYINKMAVGLFMTVLSFAWIAVIQMRLDAGLSTSIIWQLPAYFLLTAAEVMVSVTCLEFSYTQAPLSMKSFVMSFYLAAVAVGNLLTSLINFVINNAGDTKLFNGAGYFWLFSGLMLMTALAFVWKNRSFTEQAYWQKEA